QTYRSGLKTNPGSPELWQALWDLYAGHKQYSEAIGAYKKGIEADPANATAHLHLGHVYNLLNVDDTAFDEFQQVLKLDPKNAAALLQIGNNYLDPRKDYETTAEPDGKALEIAPDFKEAVEALANAGLQLGGDGRLDEAEKIFKDLCARYPDNGYYASNLGLVYRDGKKYDEALKCYEKAAKLLPEDPQVINDYALVLDYHFNRQAAALPLYLRALELGDNVDAMQNLCRLYKMNGQYEEAIRIGERALKKDPARDEVRADVQQAKEHLKEEKKRGGAAGHGPGD